MSDMEYCYRIEFRKVDREQMIEASKDSFLCDYSNMENLFNICLRNN